MNSDGKNLVQNNILELSKVLELLRDQIDEILAFSDLLAEKLLEGGSLFVFGNGGSAATASHFAAEFTGKLKVNRPPISAHCLNTDTSVLTAISNDFGFDEVFRRQVLAHVGIQDVVVGISTSGKSQSVLIALEEAERLGAVALLLTGKDSDYNKKISVPHSDTARVQEAHDLILHSIAQVVERTIDASLKNDSSSDRFPFLLTLSELSAFRGWASATNLRIGSTNGVFDLFHHGHYLALRAASKDCDRLVVFLNDDNSAKQIKGASRPIKTQDERIEDIFNSKLVSHVVLMADVNAEKCIEELKPDFHFKGGEYEGKQIAEEAAVIGVGGSMRFTPRTPGVSTSRFEGQMKGST